MKGFFSVKFLVLILIFKVLFSFGQAPALQVFFTVKDPVEALLLDALHNAGESVDAALYDLGLENVARVLVLLKQKGVRVRVVSDADYEGKPAFEILKAAGIPVVFDHEKSLMHNKFLIIDRKRVWTGSVNLTPRDMGSNRNNALLIESPEMALEFEKEFLEMFEHRLFGRNSPENTKSEAFAGDTAVRFFFAPETRADLILEKEIRKTEKSIRVAAFAFTHKELLKAMLEKKRQGVTLEILLDRGQAKNPDSVANTLLIQEIPFQLYTGRGKLHHKFMVLDEKTVITGSFNFSKNASLKNDENLLIIENSELAGRFIEEFQDCLKGRDE